MKRQLIVVLDTNVLVNAMRSSRGPSSALLRLLADEAFVMPLSAAVALEYEEVLIRELPAINAAAAKAGAEPFTTADMQAVVDYLCRVGIETKVQPKGPFLAKRAADDEKFVELAAAAGADYLTTYNIRDYAGAETIYNGRVSKPEDVLRALRGGSSK